MNQHLEGAKLALVQLGGGLGDPPDLHGLEHVAKFHHIVSLLHDAVTPGSEGRAALKRGFYAGYHRIEEPPPDNMHPRLHKIGKVLGHYARAENFGDLAHGALGASELMEALHHPGVEAAARTAKAMAPVGRALLT